MRKSVMAEFEAFTAIPEKGVTRCHPLPANRVRIVRGGQLYPWRAPDLSEFSPPLGGAGGGETAPAAAKPPGAKKPVIEAICPNGRVTRFLSVEAAAAVMRVSTREIERQCNGKPKAYRMKYRFRIAG